jgi:hypothetical protein
VVSASTRRWLAGRSLVAKVKGQDTKRVALAAAAVVVAVVLVGWLVLRDGGDPGPPHPLAEQQGGGKTLQVVSASDLLQALAGVGYPVYWAGLRPDVEYEVTRFEDGQTFVRYLPEDEEPGTKHPYLTVGSYARPNAVASVKALGKEGGLALRLPGGGVGFAEGVKATSVYLAFPGVGTQIEVYDPQPGQALQLVRSGVISPVG